MMKKNIRIKATTTTRKKTDPLAIKEKALQNDNVGTD